MQCSPSVSLREFHETHDKNFSVDLVDASTKQSIWDKCLHVLENDESPEIFDCFACLRILTRDSQYCSKLTSEYFLKRIVTVGFPHDIKVQPRNITVEALKALSNVIFQQPQTIVVLKILGIQNLVAKGFDTFISESLEEDMCLLYLKIIFLLTGFDIPSRLEFALNFNILASFDAFFVKYGASNISFNSFELIEEALRALYNIIYAFREDDRLKTKFIVQTDRLVTSLRGYLIKFKLTEPQTLQFFTQIINFLNVVPKRSYKYLRFDSSLESNTVPYGIVNEMDAIETLIEYLAMQLEQQQFESGSPSVRLDESICPILNVLFRACQSDSRFRKYIRSKILPSLGEDVERLPEEGNTIRNRLCKLLTNPQERVCELVALLLFKLCKENIDRAIKYTGFGNFAGFLARHALLAKPKVKTQNTNTIKLATTSDEPELSSGSDYYSSTDESDTEEYKKRQDNINPVTGRWEIARPNPMDGITDEQKEYITMELVEKIDKLQRSGLIQPGTVGDDGRVRPVKHVLELLESKPDIHHGSEDSSED